MTQSDAWRMLQRSARDADIPTAVCNHTFRATGITAYLDNGGSLENAQAMAAHESPRTTKLYDRTDDQITLDEVEKIGILGTGSEIFCLHPNRRLNTQPPIARVSTAVTANGHKSDVSRSTSMPSRYTRRDISIM